MDIVRLLPYHWIMAHKTTVTLPDDLHATWKRSGRPLADVIRSGLDGTGDTARHAATETRLAQLEARHATVEQRLAALEAGAASATAFGAEDQADAADFDPEEWAREREERERAKMDDRRARLLASGKNPVTVTDAIGVFHVAEHAARSWLKQLAGYGYAEQLDHAPGEPYRWMIREPGEGASDGI
jgi:hypothetical protein